MGPSASKLWPTVAPDWIMNGPEWLNDLGYDIYKSLIFDDRYMMFVDGLINTLKLTAMALILGVILGVVVALIRVTWDKTCLEIRGPRRIVLAIANFAAKVYLTVIRGTPVIVQLLILYYVVFASSRNKLLVGALSFGINSDKKVLVAILAFGINSGAYVAEIIRSGIMSIDPGQMEAGRSLGFGYVATMRHIILPQAFKNVLPTLANEFIVLLKETAVAGYVGLNDLTYVGNIIGGNAYDYLFPLLISALVYLTLVMFFTFLVGKLERRLRNSER